MTGASVVYITGHGHSGSTLLDVLLGQHPRIASAGEVEFLSAYGASDTPPSGCACGRSVAECAFWSAIARRLGAADSRAFWRRFEVGCPVAPSLWSSRFHALKLILLLLRDGGFRTLTNLSPYLSRYREAALRSWAVFDAVAEVEGKPFVVDASKTPTRLRLLQATRPGAVWAVHLIRDGRGLAASEKVRGLPVEVSALSWRRRHREVQLLTRTLPSARLHELRYEALCANPEHELRRLCVFLGLTFDAAMLRPVRPGHGVGGSGVRFEPARSAALRLDERWKQLLSGDDLRRFTRVAGRLNARLGYG